MKKAIITTSAIVILLAFNFASANGTTKGNPFQELWGAIDWLQEQIDNIELIPGPQGEQGAQGESGIDGQDGLPGEQGEQGIQGEQGEPGQDAVPQVEMINLWSNFFTSDEMNDSEFIDVSDYIYARLQLSWGGDVTHPCQYAYRYSNDGSTVIYDSTYNGSSCNVNVDIPLTGAQYLQIGAYTPPNGTLNAFLYLYNTPEGPMGPQGLEGPRGIQGLAGPTLHLYDGAGQDLGVLISNSGREEFKTYINFGNRDTLLQFKDEGTYHAPILDLLSKGVWFPQPNCEGEPFVNGEHLYNQNVYNNYDTSNYYFTVRFDTGASRNAVSRIDSVAGCESWSNNIPLSYLIEPVTLPFNEPLTWPLRVAEQ